MHAYTAEQIQMAKFDYLYREKRTRCLNLWFYLANIGVAYYCVGCNEHTTFEKTNKNSTNASKFTQHTTYVQMNTPGKSRVVTYLSVSYMHKTM